MEKNNSKGLRTVDIWTDGAASPNPGNGGFGAILYFGDKFKELSGSEANTTNNRMEMLGALRALEALKEPCIVTLRSDSNYLVSAFTKKWIAKWKKNGWKTASGEKVKNQDLWEQLWAQSQKHQIEWVWVKGHADDPNNQRCDELAVAARLALVEKLQNGG